MEYKFNNVLFEQAQNNAELIGMDVIPLIIEGELLKKIGRNLILLMVKHRFTGANQETYYCTPISRLDTWNELIRLLRVESTSFHYEIMEWIQGAGWKKFPLEEVE